MKSMYDPATLSWQILQWSGPVRRPGMHWDTSALGACALVHYHSSKAWKANTHPAMLPQTEQNLRGLAVVGGPTAAVRYDGTFAGKSSRPACTHMHRLSD